MLFHKNRNTQIQVYTIQHLELETSKIVHCIVHWKGTSSIVHWEGTSRRP